ncbi:MAG: hypothetical protein RBU21_03060 [FCB group bacterium]|jgi:photosystem II stability/assembly factor-like uncharacterized protein|nr:hypothetical protein [FCB group bacterium]
MRRFLLAFSGALLAWSSPLSAEPNDTWKQPLAEKAIILEQGNVERHNILGLYPSQVEVPLDGRPVDNTSLGIGNIAHSICWTSNYLAGATYRYAHLKRSGAPAEEVQKALERANELFEAVYRCQLVTGVPGLQARGYALGHGESYEERWDEGTRDEWHQGTGEYKDLRWRGEPSHHNYSDAIHGLGQFYDLAAEGEKKDRCRAAIDALVSYWVDNNLEIYNYERKGSPTPILGMTDGRTLNTRIMMAIAGAKVAHHATGNEKFKKVYDQLCAQYDIRGLKEFKPGKSFDDAEHVFCHLENLFRMEKDPELLAGFRVVLNGLWDNHKNDGQSLFTYIYLSLTPDAADRDKALRDALFSLQTYPTDTTLRPAMNSINKDLKPPYPTFMAAWDNEYLWKGSLTRADGWLSRRVLGVAVSPEDPVVLYAFDEKGDLYQSRDGGATFAGWRSIDHDLVSPVRALDAGNKLRILVAACDDGFYKSATAGHAWQRMPVPDDGGKPTDIFFHPESLNVIFATTTRAVYRSRDFGQRFFGESWECLTEDLPPAKQASYTAAASAAHPGRIYALLDGVLFTRKLDEATWQRGGEVGLRGLGDYGNLQPWLRIDPSNPDHALVATEIEYPGLGVNTLLQETRDGGVTWTNDMKYVYEVYSKGGIKAVTALMIPGAIVAPSIDPRNPQVVYTGGLRGILRSTDGGATWEEKKSGLDIPVGRVLMAPRHTDWIFADTPGGLFLSKDRGETWSDAHLCPMFQDNTRRELGGAAYIDAYWRGRYYGLIDDAASLAPITGEILKRQ